MFRAAIFVVVPLFMVGCASSGTPKPDRGLPSAAGAAAAAKTATQLNQQAIRVAESVKKGSDPSPVALRQLYGLLKDMETAHQAVLAELGELQNRLNTAVVDLERSQEKLARLRVHVEKRNRWTVGALLVGAAVYQAGAWAKMLHPHTRWLPGWLCGAAAVLIAAFLVWLGLSLWSGAGWLGGLFS